MSHRARTRHWYIAVVPAVLFALAASSFRYVDVYRPNAPTERIAGAVGESLHIEQTATVEGADNLIAADVTLTSAQLVRREDVPEMSTGADIDIIAVNFDWAASPDIPLRTCDLRLISEAGKRYLPSPRLSSALVNPPAVLHSVSHCVPEDAPGPLMAMGIELGTSEYDGPPRPETWSTTVYFVVPGGTQPSAVEMIWQTPVYLEFTGVSLDSAPVSLPADARSSLSSAGAMNTTAATK
ncbi:hypothetical protein [Corynebacterium nasicanis]|uniref:Uncharacterized protein n=1 Tax=Corynebacterium nasicanis TaxID=1448267 RepID=A0ABW1Q9X4_9CORY